MRIPHPSALAACVIMRRQTFHMVGGFDPRYAKVRGCRQGSYFAYCRHCCGGCSPLCLLEFCPCSPIRMPPVFMLKAESPAETPLRHAGLL